MLNKIFRQIIELIKLIKPNGSKMLLEYTRIRTMQVPLLHYVLKSRYMAQHL